jgi:hypothetical protein
MSSHAPQGILTRHYLKINLPGVFVFLLLYGSDRLMYGGALGWGVNNNWMIPTLLALQGLFAIAFPLWYRILFVQRLKGSKTTSPESFLHFEKKFLSLACPCIYLLIPGYLLSPSRATFAAMVLFALYALYFYFPSRKRIAAEKRMFRVKN